MTDPVDPAARLLDRLRDEGRTLATAESLTGGLVGASLTAVPGSSDVYLGGVVSYAISIKTAVLSVPEAIIEDHGVVSEECAVAMADGARALTGCRPRRRHHRCGRSRSPGRGAGRHRLGGRVLGRRPRGDPAGAVRRP